MLAQEADDALRSEVERLLPIFGAAIQKAHDEAGSFDLEAPHKLGMTTVLVHSEFYDHPIQAKIKNWAKPPEHVHHMTDDLTGFLAGIEIAPKSST